MYFIDYIKTYSSVNKKGKELQSFVEPFKQVLFTSDAALDKFISDLEKEIAKANERYPRSQPISFTEYNDDQYEMFKQLAIWVVDNSDKIVCVIGLKKVLRVIE